MVDSHDLTAEEIAELEAEEDYRAEAAREMHREIDAYLAGRSTITDPLTDQDLWRYIKYKADGLKRDVAYWDDRASFLENRRAWRYLDRPWGKGRSIDCLAGEIGGMWPWFGITDADSMWAWMQRTRKCR